MKKNIILITILVLLLSFSTISFAEENGPSSRPPSNSYTEENEPSSDENLGFRNNMFVDNGEMIDAGLPTVTTDDITDWADKKGFEIIGFLQKIAQPFAIVVFIGNAFMALLGILGNGHLVSKGFIGMLIALIVYAVVLYAPEIMDIFLGWVSS